MPEAITSHSDSHDEKLPTDPLEARLALAEKEVSMALDGFDYDALITIASVALKASSKLTSKTVIKSRKNLFWARSHAYHHKGIHDLALKDARAALKIDTSDPASYIRTAVMLKNAGHQAQAASCLDAAVAIADKFEQSAKTLWLRRIDKQRNKLFASSQHPIDRLPTEILIEVAQHLGADDRSSMSQTNRKWHHILTSSPSLWTSMTVKMRTKRLSESKAAEWLDHIIKCANRCNNGLERVEFSGSFPGVLLDKVLSILRTSAPTLVHIAIPTSRQQRCYQLLYRYCPRLKSLELRSPSDITIQASNANNVQQLCRHEPIDESAEVNNERFQLETFRNLDNNAQAVTLSLHAQNLRFLQGHFPSTSVIDHMLFLNCLRNLEEWDAGYGWETTKSDVNDRDDHPTASVPCPKLRKLDNFWFTEEYRLVCPQLQELDIKSTGLPSANDWSAVELTRMLNTSPLLRRLKVRSGGHTRLPRDMQQAFRALQHLEYLELDFSEATDYISDLLLPKEMRHDHARQQLDFPFPKLQHLVLYSSKTDLTKLAHTILVRQHLRNGQNLPTAKYLASERLRNPQESAAAPSISPFQRGTASSTPTPSSPRRMHGPRLDEEEAQRCCPLDRLELRRLVELPAHVEQALRSVVPELLFEYDPL
ncbi:uncharacterized protein UTRI_10531_B [Ustilago trichophora]|uniref:F-box domain-containing protein n=1 Tax=Ustilago trichophora TaxID=86804 RepID=A0A5C3E933_9BASI|nr:uncharacterized protein UTRI_10531_B [Ustilago trichophora]